MKRLFVLLALFVGLSSCSQDDAIHKPEPTPEEPVTHIKSLVGTKWVSAEDVLVFGDTECRLTHFNSSRGEEYTQTAPYTYNMPVLKLEWQEVGWVEGSKMKFNEWLTPDVVYELEFSLVYQ